MAFAASTQRIAIGYGHDLPWLEHGTEITAADRRGGNSSHAFQGLVVRTQIDFWGSLSQGIHMHEADEDHFNVLFHARVGHHVNAMLKVASVVRKMFLQRLVDQCPGFQPLLSMVVYGSANDGRERGHD